MPVGNYRHGRATCASVRDIMHLRTSYVDLVQVSQSAFAATFISFKSFTAFPIYSHTGQPLSCCRIHDVYLTPLQYTSICGCVPKLFFERRRHKWSQGNPTSTSLISARGGGTEVCSNVGLLIPCIYYRKSAVRWCSSTSAVIWGGDAHDLRTKHEKNKLRSELFNTRNFKGGHQSSCEEADTSACSQESASMLSKDSTEAQARQGYKTTSSPPPCRPPYLRPKGMTHYDVIGVTPDAPLQDIRKAYLTKARELHPDVNSTDQDASEKFVDLQLAYQILSNPLRRSNYDKTLQSEGNARYTAMCRVNSVVD